MLLRQRRGYVMMAADFYLHLLFIWPFKLVRWCIRKIRDKIQDHKFSCSYDDDDDWYDCSDDDEWVDDEDNEQQIQDELSKYANLPPIPEMCQTFPLEGGGCIGVEYVSMCPDETAHIRIIGDTTFSQQYKRKVYREKTYEEERYFKLNNVKYYLDEKRTQPIAPTQAKPGK